MSNRLDVVRGRSESMNSEDRSTNQPFPEGNAIVYCEGAFGTTNGKTAHGLIRRSRRYKVLAVVDSVQAEKDAGEVLDGRFAGIPIEKDVMSAYRNALAADLEPTHLVVGLAPDGGRLDPAARSDIRRAIRLSLNVDSGLHDYLSDDVEIAAVAEDYGVTLRDVRKPPSLSKMHFFSGKITEVESFKVAVLGTDSAVGKRTTAWMLVDALAELGLKSELVGTGQTAWLQGARYGIVLDSLVNDFVAGEIEHAVWTAWTERLPEVIVLEGQGSLMNPAYPGGYELLAAGRPDVVVLQHAPARKEYDGFPGHRLHSLDHQIKAIEVVSGRPVVAITINHEDLAKSEIEATCDEISREIGLPVFDVLTHGADKLARRIHGLMPRPSAASC